MYFEVNDNEPIYVQIIKHIKVSIVTKVLEPGDEIPSRRELAEVLKVNPNTVQRAYKDMEGLGLIETIRNFPSKITINEEVLTSLKKELLLDAVGSFTKSMKELKLSKEEVIALISESY
ncbi:GntR family transcriptional regulator [uncultured Clostridium sp.]|uniref:GntR family transcriptional regulator n=1 Tax=uncultured Clostridium sp. TaxID=59620 RepID=UPI00260BD696|nr:GntR family transcriptional regulator [uncultured Clostridium sp.]